MTYLFFIILSFLCENSILANNLSDMNVGTVLFTETDYETECWTNPNIALLTSRMLFEDLLPDKSVLTIQDNTFINDIIDYFRLLLDVVRKVTFGKTKHVMLIALTDVLGGYLNCFVLPNARYAYYAGYINFGSVEKLYKLFDELKCFLRTNGHGWSNSRGLRGNKLIVEPLEILPPPSEPDPCNLLAIVEGKSGMEIPLPFFDSRQNPLAIAVPFKTHPLLAIESKAASYILVKYYITSLKCLHHHKVNQTNLNDFNGNLYNWIHGQVMPLLSRDKFYSAFGGVLRIVETLKRMGLQYDEKKMGNYNIMPEMQLKDSEKYETEEMPTMRKKSNLILMALLATIFIWFLLGSIFVCYRIKSAKYHKRGVDDKALFSINTCSCKSSAKSVKEISDDLTSSNSKSREAPTKRFSPSNSVYSVESNRSSKASLPSASGTAKKKSGIRSLICYMASKEVSNKTQNSNPSIESVLSARDTGKRVSIQSTTDTKVFTLHEDKPNTVSPSFAVQTSFSEGLQVGSSSDEMSRDQTVAHYNIDTSSMSSESETDPSEDMSFYKKGTK